MITKIILIVLAIIVLITAWYFLWYKPSQSAAVTNAADGTPCKSGGLPGKYKNGTCIVTQPKVEEIKL